jgi:hypothetical protein
MLQSDDNISDLHARIVDVVLDFNLAASGLKNPYKGVSDRGVSEMADVRGFIRIDVGVFDDDLAVVPWKSA